MNLAIIIPAYNEGKRIGSTLSRIISYIKNQDFLSRIIVVNDGSVDDTIKVVDEYCNCGVPIDIYTQTRNKGKGASVKRGIEMAQSDYVLFSDADLSTPIEELGNMLEHIERGYDIVIGSRAMAGSDIIKEQSIGRQSMGIIFSKLVQFFVFKGIKDTQCGFKLFRTDVAKKIVRNQRIKGFAFDVELLYIARKMGYRVLEAPVKWKHVEFSRVNVIKDAFGMFLSILFIKYMHRNL
jgi:dolichyl-phosphate beta-glucosyltransferase